MELVPPNALMAVAIVCEHGLEKHPLFGWRNEDPQLFRDAGMRHHLKRQAGEVYDL